MTVVTSASNRELSYFAYLIEKIGEGSKAAEHELYLHFSRGIAYLLARQLGPDRAGELTDSVFAGLIDAIRNGEIRESESLSAYLRELVNLTIASENAGPRLERIPDRDYLAADHVLRSLPAVHREALLRFYNDGHPAEKICRELELTAAEFRAIKNQARNYFKNI